MLLFLFVMNFMLQTQDIPSSWLTDNRAAAMEQLELLRAAYDLDDAETRVVADELEERVIAEWGHTQNSTQRLAAMETDDTEAYVAALVDIGVTAPLYEPSVADWVEGLLTVERASNGRQHLEELWHRRNNMREHSISDSEQRLRLTKLLQSHRYRSRKSMLVLENASIRGLFDWSASRSSKRITKNESLSLVGFETIPGFHARLEGILYCGNSIESNSSTITYLWGEASVRAWRRIDMSPVVAERVRGTDSNREFVKILEEEGVREDLDALLVEFEQRIAACSDESR